MTSKILDHVERRLARLATIYKSSASHKGVIAALSKQIQEIEDAAFAMLTLRSITDCSAAQLDGIAKLLGVEREGRDDEALRVRLRAQVLVNSRSGEFNTLLLVLRLLSPAAALVSLTEYHPANVLARVDSAVTENGPQVASVLRLAKAAGVGLQLVYQEQDDFEVFTLGDASGASTDGQGLSSTGDSSLGGHLAGVA